MIMWYWFKQFTDMDKGLPGSATELFIGMEGQHCFISVSGRIAVPTDRFHVLKAANNFIHSPSLEVLHVYLLSLVTCCFTFAVAPVTDSLNIFI